MIFGLSNAMSERITLSGGAPEQTNFDSYQVLRIDQAPTSPSRSSRSATSRQLGEVGTMPMCFSSGNASPRNGQAFKHTLEQRCHLCLKDRSARPNAVGSAPSDV